jgi:thioesterase domain-containing protein
MILALFAFAAAVGTATYYVKHHTSAATLASVKAEVSKIQASAKADLSSAPADVKAYVAKLEAFVLSVKAKL